MPESSTSMKLARRVLEMAESETLAVAARAAQLSAQGVDVVGFGVGEPDFDTPEHICDAAIRQIRAGQTRYPKPAHGIKAAKQAVCTRVAREADLRYSPEQVIITSGGKMAFFLAMHALLDPGDEVIIPAPYWVSYPAIARLAGGVPVVIEGQRERDYKVSTDQVKRAITARTRAYIHNSPSNPGGFTYTPEQVRELAGVLARHELLVVADDIYDRLVYDGMRHLSYAAVSEAAYRQTLTINSGSKTYAMTGWRIGYACGPTELIAAMAKLQSQTTSGAATFTQWALAEALTGDQQCVETMRGEFENRARYMWSRLCEMPGVTCLKPTGAFYCFPDVSQTYERLGVKGSDEFTQRLLNEAHVAVVPGSAFGADRHVRLSFALSMENIRQGLDRMEAFLKG